VSALYHGGKPGLRAGDVLEPGHSRDHQHPGCKWCEARAAGVSVGGDGPSEREDRVYITEEMGYARYYASLFGRGDVYQVEPIGEKESTEEDRFASFTCARAVVVDVVERAVLLTMGQRRRLFIRWARRDGLSQRQAWSEWAVFEQQILNGLRGARP
jgi:hypothetical protein